VAHELRTPLTSLQLALGICEEQVVGPLTDRQRTLLAEAREDCERLRLMVSDLLDLARLEAGRLALQRQPVPVADVLERAVEGHAAVAREQGVELRSDAAAAVGDLELDRDRIQLVFSNLISNSLRHTPAGGHVTVRARTSDGGVRFEVEDDGAGIDQQHLDRVFEKFFRGPGAAPGGAGLGLWIAREVVQAHGGRVGVESAPAAGACFWFELSRTP
jgi:signal transduction histidine kinase